MSAANTPSRSLGGDGFGKQVQEVKKDLVNIREDFSTLSSDVASAGGSLVKEGKHAAKETIHRAKEKATGFHETVCDYTSEKPTQALLIALGVGAVLGMWFRGGHR